MAILGALPGIEINIESQDSTLAEYQDDSEWAQWVGRDKYNVRADKWVSTYVECISDANFLLKFSMKPPFQLVSEKLSFEVTIDGKPIAEIGFDKYMGAVDTIKLSTSCEQVGPHEEALRSLKFASIQKVDEADSRRVKSDAKAAAGIGEIQVCIYRSRREACAGKVVTQLLKNAPTEIAEKALKGQAISHGISFGEETRRPSHLRKCVYIDGHRNPLGIMIFKYRSREALRQEHIIPPSPSPEAALSRPLNPRRANNGLLSREERLARLLREVDEIKSEIKVKDETDHRKRKRGSEDDLVPAREYKTIRKGNGSLVYDLTDDN